MGGVPTTYTDETPIGLPGNIATGEPNDRSTRVIETGSGAVAFGVAVVAGTADQTAKLPTATGQDFVGVACVDKNIPVGNGEDQYVAGDNALVLYRGCVYVTVSEAVAYRDPVAFNFTTGAFGTTDDATTDLVANGVWESSAASGQVAKLRLK